MRFTDLFIRRPVLAASLSLVILLLGVRGYLAMSVRQFPRLTNTIVTVTTVYPGASPATVQGFITSRLEQAIAASPGIDYMTSTSAQGVSTITVNMQLNYSPHAALAHVMAQVDAVRNQLPTESQSPVINETVGSSAPLMYLAFYSHVLNQQQVNDYVMRVVQPKIQGVPGVGQAQIVPGGTGASGNSFAVRVWLDPVRMAALGVTPTDVVTALSANNYVSAVGRSKGRNIATPITATTSYTDPSKFRRLVVKSSGNALVRLDDVARVQLGAQNYNQAVYFDGVPSTFIAVQTTPSANELSVAHGVHKVFAEIHSTLPPGIEARIPHDYSVYIHRSIDEVLLTIGIALGIVVLVIFLFLGSVRALLIPAAAIPLSIFGGGILMHAFGFSINLLTLLAIVLAIGLVVDDAIIVVENVHRYIEAGRTPHDAAIVAARELAVPIIVMSTTVAAVFAPIAFEGGLTGSLFSEFALTLVFTFLVSMVVALTLSPMLSSKILQRTPPKGLMHALEAGFVRLRGAYDRSLHRVLDNRTAVLLLCATIVIAIPILFIGAPKALAPMEDKGVLLVSGTAPPTATRHYLNHYSRQMYKIFKSFPQTAAIFQINGISFGGGVGSNSLVGGMRLVPWHQRSVTQMQLLPVLQRKIARLTGIQAVAFQLPPLPGSVGGLPIQFVITSTASYRKINQVAGRLIGTAMKSGKFVFLSKDLRYDNPEVVLHINRNIAGSLGLSMQAIGTNLNALLGGNYVNRFDMAGRSYKVIAQVPDRLRANPDMLRTYYLRAASGALVPLSAVVTIEHRIEPEFLPQFQQLNSATIQGMMASGVSLGQGLSYLTRLAHRELPPGFGISYASQSRQYIAQGHGFLITFALSVLLVYLVLSAQFESFRDPLVVLMTVPLSICGALIFLYMGVATVNIYTEVGLVTLIGLITKQGILIVQFANMIRAQGGLDRRAAVEQASSIRLRPILMTTAAMVLGTIPLLLASGPGSASRFNMGLVIATGLSIGAFFSLYVVPVMYTYVAHRDVPHTPDAAEETAP
ncbi:MAG: efflux RND transporter permease subunit [Acidiferrobacteraceae bacterium]